MQKPLRVSARPLITLGIALAGAVAVLANSSVIDARPPSTPSPIPADAFRPITLPAEAARPTAAPPSLTPESDDRRTEPSLSPAPARRMPDPSPPAGPIHVMREGDTLWQISVWHRADLAGIIRWNAGVDPRRLFAGQRILVPNGTPMPSRPTATARTRATTPTRSTPAPNPSNSSRHLWPLPISETITTRFSAAHPGIDIAAPSGTTVRAIAGGTIVWAGWKTNGGGYVVVIRHPDGMTSTYNHNRGVAVRRGDVVTAGQRIAWVGASGWATGPHLDLRVEMGGRLVDPLALY